MINARINDAYLVKQIVENFPDITVEQISFFCECIAAATQRYFDGIEEFADDVIQSSARNISQTLFMRRVLFRPAVFFSPEAMFSKLGANLNEYILNPPPDASVEGLLKKVTELRVYAERFYAEE